MPELPEVETVRRGIAPHLTGQTVVKVIVRQPRLRWPVPDELAAMLTGQIIQRVERRAKYLLLPTDAGTLLIHLGMTGRLRILPAATPLQKHDHVDMLLADGHCLRFNDSRRFGAVLWTVEPPDQHPLLHGLGPEPFAAACSGAYLHERAQGRTLSAKAFIMDQHIVVGVGNIYANEALFTAGIHPARPAGQITLAEYERLAVVIRDILGEAIRQGGTTLRDFVGGKGEPGYFQQALRVYDRRGLPCAVCSEPIQRLRIGQRATYYCPQCQRQAIS
ncbi:MAG: bifunctional DNA-formamidopyrimidine glycosylase/DNA-(apurinic or apyrimidinic site) lyase [Candidatus Contendobacter sp.]|jgi:formamidopyrimidine-DNA glycosylase|nr:bifunctional DNA-formamidopyrimidine glycosylase/DNA-(apurinic or apyrimidinic site) lyase [Gammaproteobacteria bacterium]MCC8993741.1 bifunctional DNA-formamidopyrimidine glycosylase/DNA-(apurinic or apyrimidinic site) lyase [Candidatus Contendobacter sp.]